MRLLDHDASPAETFRRLATQRRRMAKGVPPASSTYALEVDEPHALCLLRRPGVYALASRDGVCLMEMSQTSPPALRPLYAPKRAPIKAMLSLADDDVLWAGFKSVVIASISPRKSACTSAKSRWKESRYTHMHTTHTHTQPYAPQRSIGSSLLWPFLTSTACASATRAHHTLRWVVCRIMSGASATLRSAQRTCMWRRTRT